MNCFDLHYYQLNRKLLTILGQWPYQYYPYRVFVMVTYASIMISGVYFQVLRELRVDEDLWVEHVTEGLSTIVMMLRYYTYAIYNKRIKQLLDEMNQHWETLIKTSDHEVFYASLKTQCYLVLIYMVVVVGLLALGVLAADTMYVVIILHAITLFKVASYRVEHAYDDCSYDDKYTSGRSPVYQKFISAVQCHRTAIRFAEELGNIYSIPNAISVGFNMICIAISLYWAAVSQEENFKMILSLMVATVFMVHLFFMDYPSQRLVDNSEDIMCKAYSSLWYKAPPKEQTLVLMAMQRGLRSTAIIIGKIHNATLESFASEVRASFSYFTLLLSMQ